MWCMNRTNIYLDEEQARSLDEAARAEGILGPAHQAAHRPGPRPKRG